MRKKASFLLLLALLIFLAGCPGPSPQQPGSNNTQVGLKRVLGPVTVVEEKEAIVTGEIRNNTVGPNETFNCSIPCYTYEPDKNLFVYFINNTYIKDWSENATNERHGEAILIKKGDADILIDAGPVQGSADLVNFLHQVGVDDIELFVVTHPRPENYGAMQAVFDNFEVDQFMWNNDTGNDPLYADLVANAEQKARKTIVASYLYNQSIDGIDFKVLNPRSDGQRFFDIDNDGIVFKITDRNFCLMTTGDIAYGAQTKIADATDYNPKCDILQAPNYGLGQGSSNIDLFLLKVAPKSAVITGSYFDPADERYSIEDKFKLRGIKYYEGFNATKNATYVVRITSDGYNYSIRVG